MIGVMDRMNMFIATKNVRHAMGLALRQMTIMLSERAHRARGPDVLNQITLTTT